MSDWNDTPDDGGFMGEGEKFPALAFSEVGDTYQGVVRRVKAMQDRDFDTNEPITWPSGAPKNVYLFEIEQDNGEMGTIWVRGNAVTAIREAVKEAGGESPVGWHLKLQHHALGEKIGKRNPAKLYRAKLTPAKVTTPAPGEWDEEDPFS